MGMAQTRTSALLRSRRDDIVEDALARMWERWPGMRESFTDDQLDNTVKDTRFHVDFLASALWAGEQGLFDDYVRWVKVLFLNLDIPVAWLTGSLEDVRSAVASVLDDASAAPALTSIDAALDALDGVEAELSPFIQPAQPFGALAIRYLGSVLGGDRHGAMQIVHNALEDGTSVRDIYQHVFERTQLELGRLWQMNRITVAQEHYATAVTQMVMSQLYPRFFQNEKNGFTLVAACVGGELHEIGMRMVADFFEMEQWDTHYLGASTPADSIVEMTTERDADVLALSATMTFHVPDIANVIEALHAEERSRRVKVIVGGYPFNLAPGLWRRVGADGYAPDAVSAVTLAGELVAG